MWYVFFLFKQKTAYEMRISDWSSDVCSSDLVEDIQIDRPRGREVLVEIKASGLCHSDLHMAESDFGVPLPALFGHELAGIVKEIGPDVSEFQEIGREHV